MIWNLLTNSPLLMFSPDGDSGGSEAALEESEPYGSDLVTEEELSEFFDDGPGSKSGDKTPTNADVEAAARQVAINDGEADEEKEESPKEEPKVEEIEEKEKKEPEEVVEAESKAEPEKVAEAEPEPKKEVEAEADLTVVDLQALLDTERERTAEYNKLLFHQPKVEPKAEPAKEEPKPAEADGEAAKIVEQVAELRPSDTKDIYDFIESEEEFNETFQTKEGMNKLLSKVAGFTMNQILRAMTLTIPKLASSEVQSQMAVTEFWRENNWMMEEMGEEEAHNHATTLAAALHRQNPTWSPTRLYKETGKMARKLNGKVSQTSNSKEEKEEKKERPRHARSRGSRNAGEAKPNLTAVQKDMDDLFDG